MYEQDKYLNLKKCEEISGAGCLLCLYTSEAAPPPTLDQSERASPGHVDQWQASVRLPVGVPLEHRA